MDIFISVKCLVRIFVLLGMLELLAACAPIRQTGSVPVYTSSPTAPARPEQKPQGQSEVPSESTEQTTESIYSIAPSGIAVKPAQKAVQSLIDEAWGHYQDDDPDKAIAVAERAQRLDPRSAEVYLILASSYFVQGKQQLAEQFARRGISYSAVGSSLRSRLQQLLGQVTAL